VSNNDQIIHDFEPTSITNITQSFNLDLNGYGNLVADIHFDIENDESLPQVFNDLGLPIPQGNFD